VENFFTVKSVHKSFRSVEIGSVTVNCHAVIGHRVYTDVCRPLVNEEKMAASRNVKKPSPRSSERQFMESEERYSPVTLYATLSLDDTTKPTGHAY